MKIRKYTALNTQDAMAKVKQELGSEALIINTKKVRQKGLLGVFKKPLYEVTAALDEQAQVKAKRLASHVREYGEKNPEFGYREAATLAASGGRAAPGGQAHGGSGRLGGYAPGGGAAPGGQAPGGQRDVFSQFQTQLKASGTLPGAARERVLETYNNGSNNRLNVDQSEANSRLNVDQSEANSRLNVNRADDSKKLDATNRADAGSRLNASGSVGADNRTEANSRPLYSDLDERISDLESQYAGIESMLSKVYREVSVSSKLVDVEDDKLAPLSKVLRLFYNNLVRNEVEPEFSMHIIERVNDSLQSGNNTRDAATVLYNEVAAMLGKPETISLRQDKKPTVAIFVGPTGVGKTTTLAKIAADSALNRELDVAMITADTYRIAAVQQLKTYAEILGIPVSVVYTPDEIKNSIAEYAGKDLILIDTAGRSHRNRAQFDELRELVRGSGADEVFLVLSATSSVQNNREIIGKYDFLDEFKLLFTKADETPVFGAMLNARMLTGKCLSYVTVGQSVPDDIEVASVDKIARNLIGGTSG